METLVLDGKKFVKAAAAAKALGYTSDYVGQLCRSKKIEAHLVGRSWYVDQEALKNHKTDKKRASRVKAREQVKVAIQAAEKEKKVHTRHMTIAGGEGKAFEKRVRVSYEPDAEELMPKVKRLVVDKEPSKKKKKISKREKVSRENAGPSYTVENKGEKIVMSGKVPITDVTYEDVYEDDAVTILHAKIVKTPTPKKEKERVKKKAAATKKITLIETEEEVRVPVHESTSLKQHQTPFLTKLEAIDSEESSQQTVIAAVATASHSEPKTPFLRPVKERRSILLPFLVTFCTCVALAATLLEVTWLSIQKKPSVDTEYVVDYTDLVELKP